MKFKIFSEKPKLLNQCHTFIGGWHGLGEIGYITVSHIIQELNMERIATILSSGAPPFISIQDNQLRLPFEIYGSKDHTFAVFIPHLQPYRHVQIEFSEKLCEWILEHENFENAFFLGGVDKLLKNSESQLQYIPSRAIFSHFEQSTELITEIEENLLSPGLFVAGPLAIMLGYLDVFSFPTLGVLAYAERDRPDPLGAVAAIEKLSNILNINISTDELIKNAQVIEETIKRQLAPMEETNAEATSSRRMYT